MPKTKQKIILKNEQEIRVIYLENLISVGVQDYLCTFTSENLPDFTCTHTLANIEKLLPENFIRISRNTIVNIENVISFNKKQRKILLSNNMEYRIAVRKLDILLKRLQVET